MSEDQGKVGQGFDVTVSSGPDDEAAVVALGPRKEVEALLRWRESRHARTLTASELVLRRWPNLTSPVENGTSIPGGRESGGAVARFSAAPPELPQA